jgi:hypothetical protein
MTTLISVATQLATAWAAAAELASLSAIPALIWGIRISFEIVDRLAAAARVSYAAGRAAGRIWFAYGQPALLAAADAVSAVLAEVDWHEVRLVARQTLVTVAAMCVATAITAHTLLVSPSAALGRWYARLLTGACKPTAKAAVLPLVHHLSIVADDLQQISSRKLQSLLGCRRKISKAQMIGAYLTT